MKMHALNAPHSCRRSRRGFTLAELIVATAFAGMLTAAVLSSFVFVLRTSYGVGNYVEMNSQSRIAVEQFARDVRMARRVITLGKTAVEMQVHGLGTVTYSHDGENFVRNGPDGQRVVLADVEGIEIRYFNLFGEETESATEAKIIQLDAVMVRRILRLENTNHLISARFTLRNRDVSN